MPPSVKFTKEEIVNAALQVVREKGTAALTTRQIAAAKRFFRDVWLVAHSLAALIVTNCCPYSPEEIRQILTSVSLSVCKACKEIPEFVTNHLDRDTLFRSIIEKE